MLKYPYWKVIKIKWRSFIALTVLFLLVGVWFIIKKDADSVAVSGSKNGYSVLAVNYTDISEKDIDKLLKNNPDVVCICKADVVKLEALIGDDSEYNLYSEPSSDENAFVNAVIWKSTVFESLKENTVWLSESLNSSNKYIESEDYSLCSYVLLSSGKDSIAFFNCNLDENKTIREKQIPALVNRIRCYTSYFPVVVFGDLNLGADDSVLTSVCGFTRGNNGIYFSCAEAEYSKKTKINYITPQDTPFELDFDKKMIALTYDDGPSSGETTDRILDSFEKYNAKATLFTIGVRASADKEKLIRAFSLGFEIGNHTNNHESFLDNDIYTIRNSLKQTSEYVRDSVGVAPFLVRPPGGTYRNSLGEICKVDCPIILWSIDTKDYKNGKTPDDVYSSVVDNAFDGAIVLMHDIHAVSADSAEDIIKDLIYEGYQLVTVSEIIEFSELELENNSVYTSASRVYTK